MSHSTLVTELSFKQSPSCPRILVLYHHILLSLVSPAHIRDSLLLYFQGILLPLVFPHLLIPTTVQAFVFIPKFNFLTTHLFMKEFALQKLETVFGFIKNIGFPLGRESSNQSCLMGNHKLHIHLFKDKKLVVDTGGVLHRCPYWLVHPCFSYRSVICISSQLPSSPEDCTFIG